MIGKGSAWSLPYSGLSKLSKHQERGNSILLTLLLWTPWSRKWLCLSLYRTLASLTTRRPMPFNCKFVLRNNKAMKGSEGP